jgi:DNA N-6-adenine-methyltransferase (Dam)
VSTFVIPRDARKADNLAGELGELASATEWKRAAIVYARVQVRDHQGRPAEKVKSDLLTPAEYALLGIHGLRSKTTVRAYWRAWDKAVTEGLAEPVKLGDQVTVPSAEWADCYSIAPDCPPWANTSTRFVGQRGYCLSEDALAEELIAEEETATPSPGAHVGHNSGDSEWFTPPLYIEAPPRVMGSIDLDPASNPTANEIVRAAMVYTLNDDGLRKPWHGRVWLNPPYARRLVNLFCTKLADEYADGNVMAACVLVNNATETIWFQTLGLEASAICLPRGRVKFWHPDKESKPLQGQAVVYLGDDPAGFTRELSRFGKVWVPAS